MERMGISANNLILPLHSSSVGAKGLFDWDDIIIDTYQVDKS
jgi:hypothetical protein